MNKLKVGFDISPLESGHAGRGIGYYTQNLLSELKKDDSLEILEFTNLDSLPKVDLVHYPYFDLFYRSLKWSQPYPFVITIHDLTPLVFPEHYPPGIKGQLNLQWQKMIAKKSDGIITDSKTSKKDIETTFKIDSVKISPIYLANTDKFKVIKDRSKLNTVAKKYSLPDKFALYVGNVNWNKNLLNICQSCLDSSLPLVLVGKSFSQKTNLEHPELKIFKVFLEKYSKNPLIQVLGFVEDEDIVPIYNLAWVVMLPSFYEGFGLPILEAQACGVPVITSKIASMAEVAANSALLVDPYQISDIVKALSLLENQTLYKKLVQDGLSNIQRFSWSKTAKQTAQVYQHTAL